MNRLIFLLSISIITFMAHSQTGIRLTVGNRHLDATLADTEAARTLANKLHESPLSVTMHDYGGFEKVGALPYSLPTSDIRTTAIPGDIMLYQGNNVVIFYGENTWSYTPLGKIEGVTAADIRQFLGTGDISLQISLSESTGVSNVSDQSRSDQKVYDLSGREVHQLPLPPGIYISDGKKIAITR